MIDHFEYFIHDWTTANYLDPLENIFWNILFGTGFKLALIFQHNRRKKYSITPMKNYSRNKAVLTFLMKRNVKSIFQ